MKLHFKNITSYAAALVCGAGLLACTNLSELEDRVDSLDNRITAIENQISTLQDNINAIKALFEGQIFITEISTNDTEDEIYITMSDGNTYTITQGQIGNTPQIAVDDEGYWIVNYGDGYQRITTTVGDEELEVTSVPQFRVNDEGYWEISTDGGKSWETVTYTDGTTPVPAVGDGGDFFQDISYDEETGELSITLSDGNTYTFTVATDFVCQIVTDEDPVQFSPGSKRTFDVTMRGVQTVYIVKPDGWNVSLEGEDAADPDTEITATLTVEAPANTAAGVNTKISADSDNDIVLHAVAAASDRSIFAKMTVELSNVSMPDADITVDEVTESSITFTVTPNTDVTSWKYMLLPATAEAPDAADDFDETRATSVEGNDPAPLDLTEDATGSTLTAGTEYTLYVLVINSGDSGDITDIISASATPMFSTYSDAYNAGLDITIGGTTFNKATYGAAIEINESTAEIKITTGDIAGTAVYFINNETSLTFEATSSDGYGTLLIIGNDMDQKVNVSIEGRIFLNRSDDDKKTLLCHNIVFDGTGLTNSPLAFNTGDKYNNVIFSECDIYWPLETNFIYNNVSEKPMGKIVFDGCKLDFNSRTPKTNRPMMACGNGATSVDEFVFNNNIVYSSEIRDVRLLLINSGTVSSLSVTNNTFINAWQSLSGGTPVFFSIGTVGNVKFSDNLIWASGTTTMNANTLNLTNITGSTNIGTNILYNTTANGLNLFHSNSQKVDGASLTTITDDPFAGGTFKLETGTFIPNSTYSSYGAQQ